MGSLAFGILWALGHMGELANDYQFLPIIVSLDSIAIAVYMHMRANQNTDTVS